MDIGKAADILNTVVKSQVHGITERNPRENEVLWDDCFEVKRIFPSFLRLAGTSEGLNWPGWAAVGSPLTLTLAHSLYPYLITVFRFTLIGDMRD